jgi:hypothetical protein
MGPDLDSGSWYSALWQDVPLYLGEIRGRSCARSSRSSQQRADAEKSLLAKGWDVLAMRGFRTRNMAPWFGSVPSLGKSVQCGMERWRMEDGESRPAELMLKLYGTCPHSLAPAPASRHPAACRFYSLPPTTTTVEKRNTHTTCEIQSLDYRLKRTCTLQRGKKAWVCFQADRKAPAVLLSLHLFTCLITPSFVSR